MNVPVPAAAATADMHSSSSASHAPPASSISMQRNVSGGTVSATADGSTTQQPASVHGDGDSAVPPHHVSFAGDTYQIPTSRPPSSASAQPGDDATTTTTTTTTDSRSATRASERHHHHHHHHQQPDGIIAKVRTRASTSLVSPSSLSTSPSLSGMLPPAAVAAASSSSTWPLPPSHPPLESGGHIHISGAQPRIFPGVISRTAQRGSGGSGGGGGGTATRSGSISEKDRHLHHHHHHDAAASSETGG
jgi:hypothetical protein